MHTLRRSRCNEDGWNHVRALIAAGSDPNAHTDEGMDVLMCWMRGTGNGYPWMLDELLAAGATPHPKVAGKSGPLAHAIIIGSKTEVIQRLLEAGADPDESDAMAMTPMQWARTRPEIQDLLISCKNAKVASEMDCTLPASAGSPSRIRL